MHGVREILLLALCAFLTAGCAAAPQWRQSLWHAENPTHESPEIGALMEESLEFNAIVTEFRKVISNNQTDLEDEDPTLIAVSVSCRNRSKKTLILEDNPIQVVGPSQMLVQELPLEHVMYKLYGGKLRAVAQSGRLADLSEPVPVGSSVPDAIIAGIVEGFRQVERTSIGNEIYQKESAQYQLYYQSFAPVSLPPGVATSWTQYYPYTSGPIQVVLQGQTVEEGVSFALPPPLPKSASKRKHTINFDSVQTFDWGKAQTPVLLGFGIVVIFIILKG